ncbi:MAG: peptide chain release factor N(5)-glutamine methyltransferase [Chitinophagaceae bacterium]
MRHDCKSKCIKFVIMTVREAEKHITEQLTPVYKQGEANSIATLVIEYITGTVRTKLNSIKQNSLIAAQSEQLHQIIKRLQQHEPVQYILNESWFCGLKFYVDKCVLIPRSETEELVEWIIDNCRFPIDELKIMDMGSGSGCIPIALKRRIRKAEVWSCDISNDALAVAKKNAETLGADVKFEQLDFLDKHVWDRLPEFDIIVSNPPYVPQKDKTTMQTNVLNFEPPHALFVPDNDPLIFYRAIAEFGKSHLRKKGAIYCEIHEDLGKEVIHLFESCGYISEIKKDMQQKDRMVLLRL